MGACDSLLAGAGVWAMAGTSGLDPVAGASLGESLGEIPAGMMGGMIGGVVTGILLEIFGAHLEEHEQAV